MEQDSNSPVPGLFFAHVAVIRSNDEQLRKRRKDGGAGTQLGQDPAVMFME